MIIKVRTRPIEVFYCTSEDARKTREHANIPETSGPCFATSDMGQNGFCWDTIEEFENDYALTFSGDNLPSHEGEPLKVDVVNKVIVRE